MSETLGDGVGANATHSVSSNELTRMQIALSQAGQYGRWICEDALGWVEFDSQDEADRALMFAAMHSPGEVSEAQADAAFDYAARHPLDPATKQRLVNRVLAARFPTTPAGRPHST